LLGGIEPCCITTTINYHTAKVRGSNLEITYPEVVEVRVYEEATRSGALMQAMRDAVLKCPDVLKTGVPENVIELAHATVACGPIIPIVRTTQPRYQEPTQDGNATVESTSYSRFGDPIEETTTQVRCVAIDAGVTPLYMKEGDDQLDPRYILHVLMLQDTRNEISGRLWTQLRVLKVMFDGQEVQRKADGSFNDEISAVLENDLHCDKRRIWLYDHAGTDSKVRYVHANQTVEFTNIEKINGRKTRIETTVKFHRVCAEGVTPIEYPEVVWVFTGDVCLCDLGCMSNSLHFALFEQLIMDDKALLSGLSKATIAAARSIIEPRPSSSRLSNKKTASVASKSIEFRQSQVY
jgi:hypothetical protein